MIKIEKFDDGLVVSGDSTSEETVRAIASDVMFSEGFKYHLVIADPPYGNIVDERWDKIKTSDDVFAKWMLAWTQLWTENLEQGRAAYIWGGVGKPGFRPFFKFMPMVEESTSLELANLVTWSKKRAYGVQNNYIFTREELAYFIKGDAKHPKVFNIPLLETKRGYAGFNKKYPAKSEFYRRTNVWTDVNELFKGKVHPTQKPVQLHEIMINTNTNPGEIVIDPFAGCGTTALAARALGRRFVVIENDSKHFEKIIESLR
jgi:DNA modification methylase